jgi:aspartyl protease family protein
MAIERLLRNVMTLGSIAIAAPFFAPALLTYTVMQGDITDMSTPLKPKPAAASKPAPVAATSPLPPLLPSDPAHPRTVTLRADPHGGFQANPIINGHAVKAVVDTGATTVAISDDTARRLGVLPARGDYDVMVSTANGVTGGAQVMLREIKVGDVTVRNVEAIVLPGYGLDTTLLGMSFLKRLQKFEMSGGTLILTQ